MMRPIVNSTFVTLDGVVNHLDVWHFDYVDDESQALALEQLTAADALLMGRHTYDVYSQSWPERTGEMPDRINAMTKYVVSRTVSQPTWTNSQVLGGDLVEEAERLKNSAGGPILMHGFGPVAKALLGAGLLDELHLWYHPWFAGVGDAGDQLHTAGLTVGLETTGARTLKSGVVVLSFRSKAS